MITSQRYKDAIRADSRKFICRIEVDFPAGTEEFTGDQITKMSLLEESKGESDNPMGLVTSNEFRFSIENSDRRFSPSNESSPYYGEIRPGIKVRPYIGLILPPEEEGEEETIEEIPLGVFWVNDWQALSTSIEATVVCYDRLYSLLPQEVPMLPVFPNTTIGQMFVSLFRALGLNDNEFYIGSRLNIPVRLGWLPRGKVGQALNLLAVAGSCTVSVNRNGVVEVRSMLGIGLPTTSWTDSDMIFSVHNPQRYRDVFSSISIGYALPGVGESETILNIKDIDLPNGLTRIENIPFRQSAIARVESVELIGVTEAFINDFKYGATSMSLEIINPGEGRKVDVRVIGRPVSVNVSDLSLDDSVAVAEYGKKVLRIENFLIQSERFARTYASALIAYVKNPKTTFSIESRGDQSVTTTDYIEILSPSDSVDAPIVVQPIRMSLDFEGGLQASIEARLPIVPLYWTMISPGLYAYTQARI